MTGPVWSLAAIVSSLGVMLSACAREPQFVYQHPPDSTYVVSAGELRRGEHGEHGETVEKVRIAEVSAAFFEMVGGPPLLGRALGEHDFDALATPTVVLSHRFWKSQLGAKPETVGVTLQVDGRDHNVVGVMPAQFEWPPGVDVWVPQAPLGVAP